VISAPLAAADVLGERVADALGASDVAFLMADFSGQALIRLGHASSEVATRTHGRQTDEPVLLTKSPHGRVFLLDSPGYNPTRKESNARPQPFTR
jgi:hypothetical protein